MDLTKQTNWQLTEVAKLLNKHRIKFYITASYAVYFYTKVNVPGDVDLVVRRQDIEKIETIFSKKFERISFGNSGTGTILRLGNTVEMGCFDNIYSKGKKFNLGFRDSIYDHTQKITVKGIKLHIIPIEELIALKLILNRKSSRGVRKSDEFHAIELLKSGKVNWFRMIKSCWKYKLALKLMKLRLKL